MQLGKGRRSAPLRELPRGWRTIATGKNATTVSPAGRLMRMAGCTNRGAAADDPDRDEPHGAEAPPARQSPQPHRQSRLLASWRRVAPSVTRRDPDVAPKKSRRRRGDDSTSRHFQLTAKFMRRRVRPASIYAPACLWLADTLDWLDLWSHAAADDFGEDYQATGRYSGANGTNELS